MSEPAAVCVGIESLALGKGNHWARLLGRRGLHLLSL